MSLIQFLAFHSRISVEDNRRLIIHVSKKEFHAALLDMNPDKSSGPDGFNLAFYQNLWDLCGNDI